MRAIRALSDRTLKDLREAVYELAENVAFDQIPAPDDDMTADEEDERFDQVSDLSDRCEKVIMDMLLQDIRREY